MNVAANTEKQPTQALSPDEIDFYAGYTFLKRQSPPNAKDRIDQAISEIERSYPGRIVESEKPKISIETDGVTGRICSFVKKGETPADFSRVIKEILEKHWG